MIIGKKEQDRLEREQCAQISLLCRQKLMGYAESFEELGKSFRQEIQIAGEDRQNILEKMYAVAEQTDHGRPSAGSGPDHGTGGRRGTGVLSAGREKEEKPGTGAQE